MWQLILLSAVLFTFFPLYGRTLTGSAGTPPAYPAILLGEEHPSVMHSIARDSVVNFTIIGGNLNCSPRKKYQIGDSQEYCKSPGWGILIAGGRDSGMLKITVRVLEEQRQLEPDSFTLLTVSADDSIISQKRIRESEFPQRTQAILKAEIFSGKVTISGGNDARKILWEGELPTFASEIGVLAEPGSKLRLQHVSLIQSPELFSPPLSDRDPYYIEAVLQFSSDPLTGYWALLDSSYESANTRLGGDYLLGCLAENNGEYYLYYLSGAEGEKWKPGMVKGVLYPTAIKGVYNVEWRAHSGGKVNERVKAQIDKGLLNIYFPESNATLRFQAVGENPALTNIGERGLSVGGEPKR